MHPCTKVSLTPSMDDADAEVAGIYKAFSTGNPLTARMDSLATPPPPQQEGKAKQPSNGSSRQPRIELVETPDCTSIDTTIPEEEIEAFRRGAERRRELGLNG